MMCNTGIIQPPCENRKTPTLAESVQYLPDSIRKEVRLLCKQYKIISIEQCAQSETFTKQGFIISTIIESFHGDVRYLIKQEFDIKIEYMNTETGQTFYKVLLSY